MGFKNPVPYNLEILNTNVLKYFLCKWIIAYSLTTGKIASSSFTQTSQTNEEMHAE
jgi:hypothetical protein